MVKKKMKYAGEEQSDFYRFPQMQNHFITIPD